MITNYFSFQALVINDVSYISLETSKPEPVKIKISASEGAIDQWIIVFICGFIKFLLVPRVMLTAIF